MFGPHDGRRVRVHPYRRMMTFLMRGRNESAVYFEQELDLSRAQPWLAERRVKLFPLILHALAHTLHERERLNRFTLGHRVYQRTSVQLSFAAKKQKTDDAPLAMVKRAFSPTESLAEVSTALDGDISEARSDRKSHIDKELGILLALPAFLLTFLIALNKRLYKWGIGPKSFVDTDPLYASAVVANLGSIQLDAAYHHLYEHGNCPLFVTVGRVRGDKLTIKYTFDERIEDGHYAARSLDLFKAKVEDPASWL
ncbi:MAG: hypothetical protein QM831_20210 [Kofleriaceae bacterium]